MERESSGKWRVKSGGKKNTEKVKRVLDSGSRDINSSSHRSFINRLYDPGQSIPHLRASNPSFQMSLLEYSFTASKSGKIETGLGINWF